MDKLSHNQSEHHYHHHHHHADLNEDTSGGRLLISILLNLLISVAELIGGLLSNSLALLSDSVHNFSDTASLGISLGARKIGKKEADKHRTFGYKRAEIIGAFINLIVLVIVSFFLIKEGIQRMFVPEHVNGPIMFTIAIIGLIGNFVSAWLLFKGSKGNLNIRSAYLHILSDGLSSVGVLIAGILIMLYHIYILDTILTIGIALYILMESYTMLRETIDILMEGTPREIDITKMVNAINQLEGIKDIHHIHIWKIDENQTCLEAHIRIDKHDFKEMESIKKMVKEYLNDHFDIGHSTLEFEFEECSDSKNGNCVEVLASEF